MDSKKPVLPEGFTSVGFGPQNWHVTKEGNTLQGIMLERFEKTDDNGDKRGAYRIRCTVAGTLYTVKVDGVSTERTAIVGDVICIDERASLKSFQTVADEAAEGAIKEVFINPLGKEAWKGGKSLWKYDMGVKTLPNLSEKERDIPF